MIHILPSVIINTKSDKFVFTSWTIPPDRFYVDYNGREIAVLNGRTAPLVWTAPNGSNIPPAVIDELEVLVKDMIARSNPEPKTIYVTVEEFISHGGVLVEGREIYTPEKDDQIGIYDPTHDSNDGCIPVRNSWKYFQMFKNHALVQIEAKPIYK